MMQLQPNTRGIVYLAVFLSIPIAILVSTVRSRILPAASPPNTELLLLMNTGLAAPLVWVVVAAVYRYLWRLRPRLFGVENLNGRWEGWYYRSHSSEICPTAHEILQDTPLTVSAQAFGWRDGQVNKSPSRIAAFAKASGSATPVLIWSYHTEGRAGDPGGSHDGTHVMTLIRQGKDRYLHGEYYNNRAQPDPKTRGAWGVIRLKHTMVGGSIDPDGRPLNWAMPVVPDDLLALQRAITASSSPR